MAFLPDYGILYEGSDKADTFSHDSDIDAVFDLRDGNDLVKNTSNSSDYIYAGLGNDTIYSGGGEDHIFGEGGNDLIVVGRQEFIPWSRAWVDGGDGHDRIEGYVGDDDLRGGEGNDVIFGGAGKDILSGDDGNDVLNGGDYSFVDTLKGGKGNDTFVIDSLQIDKVIELAGEGTDTAEVRHGQDYTLGANLENITVNTKHQVDSSGNILNGNSLNNVITGGDRTDTLSGKGGDDTVSGGWGYDTLNGDDGKDVLYGEGQNDTANGGKGNDKLYDGDGNDWLYGNEDNDLLVGGAGSDQMRGGSGNDTYAADTLDVIVEGANAGIDTIEIAAASYTLGANIENLTLTKAFTTEHAVANDLDNIIIGNSGNTTVFAFGGNDMVYGNGGKDNLKGGLGNDSLYGGAEGDLLYGQEGSDKLYGDAGNDVLTGGAGADRLEGGAGGDRFVYTSLTDSTYAAADKIVGFDFGADKIDLEDIDADTTQAGLQHFHFAADGKPFFGDAGTLWTEVGGAGIRIMGDTNGDNVADFVIGVYGINVFTSTFSAADFIL